MEISLSILDLELDKDFKNKISVLDNTKILSYHIDVMTNEFVGRDTVNSMYSKASNIRNITKKDINIHLMTEDIKRNIELFSFLNPNSITFHLEAVNSKEDVKKYIKKILENNILVGISINPDTPIDEIYEFLPYISRVLVMTVIPGKGGQKLISETLEKVIKLKKYIDENNYQVVVEVDGGVNSKNFKMLENLKIDSAVVGSDITKYPINMYEKRVELIKGEQKMLVNTKEMLLKAARENYAVGAFNFTNMENLQAILEAAEEEKSPVILQTSKAAIEYMGIDYIIGMIEAATKNITIPFALHLDHGSSFEIAKKCIDNGYTSVMIDMSSKPYEENILETRKVVEYAHPRGVTVEAELGKLAGIEDDVVVSENDALFTNPEEAQDFVTRTGIDSLAVAIGTSHGAYKFKGDAKLRFDILEEIIKRIPETPIVLHGASTVVTELVETANEYGAKIPGAKGVPDELLEEASRRGVSKINVDTDLRLAFTSEIRKMFTNNPEIFNPRDYLNVGKEKAKEIVKHKMRNVFKSSNKA